MNIPAGHVLISVTIDENGEYKEEIVGHGANSSCGTEDDDQLLRDLFGDLGEDEDWGKTCEYYDKNRVKIAQNPNGETPLKNAPKTNSEDKRLDVGFGV